MAERVNAWLKKQNYSGHKYCMELKPYECWMPLRILVDALESGSPEDIVQAFIKNNSLPGKHRYPTGKPEVEKRKFCDRAIVLEANEEFMDCVDKKNRAGNRKGRGNRKCFQGRICPVAVQYNMPSIGEFLAHFRAQRQER